MPVDDSFSWRQSVAQHSVRISQMHMADPISQLIDGPGKIFPLHHLPCRIKIRTEMLILNDVRRAKKAIRAAADHICVALEAEGHAFRSAKLRNPPKRIDVIIPLAGSIVMLRQRHTELGIVQLNAVDIRVKVTGGIGNGRFQRIRPVRDNVDFIRAQPLSHPDPTPDYLQRGLLDAFFPLRQPRHQRCVQDKFRYLHAALGYLLCKRPYTFRSIISG